MIFFIRLKCPFSNLQLAMTNTHFSSSAALSLMFSPSLELPPSATMPSVVLTSLLTWSWTSRSKRLLPSSMMFPALLAKDHGKLPKVLKCCWKYFFLTCVIIISFPFPLLFPYECYELMEVLNVSVNMKFVILNGLPRSSVPSIQAGSRVDAPSRLARFTWRMSIILFLILAFWGLLSRYFATKSSWRYLYSNWTK